MKKDLVKRLFGMFGGTMVGVIGFGANLQTFAEGAKPLSGVADSTNLGAGEYSISTPEELAKLARLVNNGYATAEGLSFVLTTNLDLTEGEAYTHGYCDKPIYVDGKVVGWYKAEEKDDGTVEWGLVPEIDTSNMTEITGETTALAANGQYVIKTEEGYKKFLELKSEENKYPAGIKVVLLGDVEGDNFVAPVRDKEGKLLSGWYEAVLKDDGSFKNWKETGNGGALCTYREV